jgi:hypothetical protein
MRKINWETHKETKEIVKEYMKANFNPDEFEDDLEREWNYIKILKEVADNKGIITNWKRTKLIDDMTNDNNDKNDII